MRFLFVGRSGAIWLELQGAPDVRPGATVRDGGARQPTGDRVELVDRGAYLRERCDGLRWNGALCAQKRYGGRACLWSNASRGRGSLL